MKWMRSGRLIFLVFLIWNTASWAVEPPVSGRPVTVDGILPADSMARLIRLESELQLIRLEMGIPQPAAFPVSVTQVAPREVYYASLSLIEIVDKLADEQLQIVLDRELERISALELQPYHVFTNTSKALDQVLAIKADMGITEEVLERPVSDDTQPVEVMEQLLSTAHLASSLLGSRFSPSEVYQRITSAINTMAQILATFPTVERIPAAPAYERRKRPYDVLTRLLSISQSLFEIAQSSDEQVLKLELSTVAASGISPKDVFIIAGLLIADINYLYDMRAGTLPVQPAYYPGVKLPAHVYQRLGILEAQLALLHEQIKQSPNWLDR